MRYHKVYGRHKTYDGGREKAPAAMCRKVIEAKLQGKGAIAIRGDGEQTRNFMYTDDGIRGRKDYHKERICQTAQSRGDQLFTSIGLSTSLKQSVGFQLRRRDNRNTLK